MSKTGCCFETIARLFNFKMNCDDSRYRHRQLANVISISVPKTHYHVEIPVNFAWNQAKISENIPQLQKHRFCLFWKHKVLFIFRFLFGIKYMWERKKMGTFDVHIKLQYKLQIKMNFNLNVQLVNKIYAWSKVNRGHSNNINCIRFPFSQNKIMRNFKWKEKRN